MPIYAGLLCVGLLAAGQPPVSIRITGDIPHAVTLSVADLPTLTRHTVTTSSHDQHGTYEGVALRDVLTEAGVPEGAAIRGPLVATYVVVSGADGYRAVFALAELDAEFTDRVVLLADKKDGAALPVNALPFQIIVPGEKRPARWVRRVVSISVQVPKSH